jgi:hypothetical protein
MRPLMIGRYQSTVDTSSSPPRRIADDLGAISSNGTADMSRARG